MFVNLEELELVGKESTYGRTAFELYQNMEFDDIGLITTEGQFKGEPYFVPYYYALVVVNKNEQTRYASNGSCQRKTSTDKTDKRIFPKFPFSFNGLTIYINADDEGKHITSNLSELFKQKAGITLSVIPQEVPVEQPDTVAFDDVLSDREASSHPPEDYITPAHPIFSTRLAGTTANSGPGAVSYTVTINQDFEAERHFIEDL